MRRGENKALDALKHENEKRLNQNEASSAFGFYVLSVPRAPRVCLLIVTTTSGRNSKGGHGTRVLTLSSYSYDDGVTLDTIASDH